MTCGLTFLPDVLGVGIDVRVERDGRRAGHVPGHGGEDEAVLVLHRVLEAHREQFVAEHLAEHELPGRTRVGRGLLVRLGVDADVAQEAVEERVRVRRDMSESTAEDADERERRQQSSYLLLLLRLCALRVLRGETLLFLASSVLHPDLRAQARERARLATRLARRSRPARPCRISRWLNAVHSACGTISMSASSTFTGSVWRVRPSRRDSRPTCVSTVMPGVPKASPRTTFAVLRPTPGSVTRSSSVVRHLAAESLDDRRAAGADVLRLVLVEARRT